MSREGLSPWTIGAALVAIGLGSVAAWYWFIQRAPVVEAPPQMVGANTSTDETPEAVPVDVLAPTIWGGAAALGTKRRDRARSGG